METQKTSQFNKELIDLLKDLIETQNKKFSAIENKLDEILNHLKTSKSEVVTPTQKIPVKPRLKRPSEEKKLHDSILTEIFSQPEPGRPSQTTTSTASSPSSQNNVSTNYSSILEDFTGYHRSKSKVETSTFRAYLTKLTKIINESWYRAKVTFKEGQNVQFLDQGLTVLHGIIEYLYVTHFRNIPDREIDYSKKARSISSAGLFKDLNLLNKMEEVFSELKNGKKPVLPKTMVRGWYERLEKIYEDWLNHVQQNPY